MAVFKLDTTVFTVYFSSIVLIVKTFFSLATRPLQQQCASYDSFKLNSATVLTVQQFFITDQAYSKVDTQPTVQN